MSRLGPSPTTTVVVSSKSTLLLARSLLLGSNPVVARLSVEEVKARATRKTQVRENGKAALFADLAADDLAAANDGFGDGGGGGGGPVELV